MNLLKTSVLNGIAVLVKTATTFILNKILAVYVGPSGYAAIGQFQNFVQLSTNFSGGVINTAVTKYTAEYYEDKGKQVHIWKVAGTIILGFSILFAFLILLFQRQLSLYFFHNSDYQSIFIWFSAFLIFYNFNALFLAILNGKKEIKKLVIANIAGSLLSLCVTGWLAYKWQLYGALVALCIYQSVAFCISFYICLKSDWYKIEYLLGKIDVDTAKKFGGFALMSLVSVFFGNLSQILLRNLITRDFGLKYAGYWEAMNKLSGAYLILVTTTLSIYYLPRLSELKTFKEITLEVRKGYFTILPLVIIICIVVYQFQDLIVKILFTDKFNPMLELLKWQLIGDVLRIGSWIVSFVMLSKAMTKIFVITEIIFAMSVIPISLICIKYFDFEGLAIAFACNSLLYWIVCSILTNQQLRKLQ